VTPHISEPPPSATPVSASGKPKKKTAEQLAREAEDEYRKTKREIGPGVDRGGSRLVTAKRRQGFIDDEDGDEVTVDRSD
jgi:transposase